MFSVAPSWTGKGLSFLYNLGKGRGGSVAKTVGTKMGMNHVSGMVKWHLFASGLTLAFGHGSPTQRIRDVGVNTAFMWATLGMNSGWRQAVWGVGMLAAPHSEHLVRGLIGGYRRGLDAQTSAAIPFSHSNINMNQAYATLAYARQRMSSTYGGLGSEASFVAARYLRR